MRSLPAVRGILVWTGLAIVIAVPVAVAAASPLLAWRDPVYIASGFAGIIALALILLQPLLAGGLLPGLPARPGRRMHVWVGATLVAMVAAHVAGLWLTSSPDVIDALLFASPTPFSAWGVVAMWATFFAAALAAFRWRLRLRPAVWRIGHSALAVVIVIGTVVHVLLVEGAMGTMSKAAFCALVVAVTAKVLMTLRAWTLLTRRRRSVNGR